MDMIEAMARAILPGIDEAADFVKECAFITAQAAARAAEPFIQARIDESVKAEREACAKVADQEALACDEGDSIEFNANVHSVRAILENRHDD